jgi:hypothetical protein
VADAGQYIGLGLTSLLQGYMQGRKQAYDQDLDRQKMDMLKQSSGDAHLKALTEQFASGTEAAPGGGVQFRPSFFDPASTEYQGFNRKAELDAMRRARGAAGGPIWTAGELQEAQAGFSGKSPMSDAVKNKPLPPGYQNMLSSPRPAASFKGSVLKAAGFNIPPEMYDMDIPAATLSNFKASSVGDANADTIAEHDSYFGQGSTKNLKPEQVFANVKAERSRRGLDKPGKSTRAKLHPNEISKFADAPAALKAVEDIRASIIANKDLFDPMMGKVNSANAYNSQAQAVNGLLKLSKQTIGKYLEGGVLRMEDERKYDSILPSMGGSGLFSVGDTYDSALAKVDNIENRIRSKYKIDLESVGGAGYDVESLPPLPAPVNPRSMNPPAPRPTSQAPGIKDRLKGFFGGNASDQRASSRPAPTQTPSDERAASAKKFGMGPAVLKAIDNPNDQTISAAKKENPTLGGKKKLSYEEWIKAGRPPR